MVVPLHEFNITFEVIEIYDYSPNAANNIFQSSKVDKLKIMILDWE